MKKINLMPSEFKKAQIIKAIQKGVLLILMVPVIYLGYLGIVNFKMVREIKDIESKISVVNDLENSIANIEAQIKDKKLFVDSLNKSEFDMHGFIKFLYDNVDKDLNIVSVDSNDRLITLEEIEDEIEEDGELGLVETAQEMAETGEDVPMDSETVEKDVENGDKNIGEGTTEEVVTEKDAREEGMELVLRGYSENSISIANLIYRLSLLEYTNDIRLSAIEEKETPEGDYNVFEVVMKIN